VKYIWSTITFLYHRSTFQGPMKEQQQHPIVKSKDVDNVGRRTDGSSTDMSCDLVHLGRQAFSCLLRSINQAGIRSGVDL